VGGTTKIPAVADLLRRATGCQELCQVHPLTAVAQGAAIHAARLSSCVPARELRSALLLDALPYAIGVKMAPPPTASASPALALPPSENRSFFVPVLAQYASVPATGSVRFALANKEQTGVTVPVVECIDDSGGHRQFETIETFQFLLRKLSMEELQSLSERFVEIRIRFTELGQLIVTAVDEHDPDHRRKYQLVGDADDEGRSKELPRPSEDAPPVGLIVTAVSLAILYVAVKLAFHEVELKHP
jgi:molecular chaperone DnaK (HSP70)